MRVQAFGAGGRLISIDFGSVSHLDCPPEGFSAELDVEGGQT